MPAVPSARGRAPFVLHAATVARVHTWLALTAFLSALAIGCALHYKKIVKNGVAGWPQEWFPSVSATIGDWYPERNIFQLIIAITSGPRFALTLFQYLIHRSAESSIPGFVLLVGILRTLSCGGWVYITSSDDHDAHDILMITYIVLNIPWMFGTIYSTPVAHTKARRRRLLTSTAFFGAIIPMIYFFLQHKVHRIPGAYTYYSFFEWSLIILDVLFDSAAELDFEAADLQVSVASSLSVSIETEIHPIEKNTSTVVQDVPLAATATNSKLVSSQAEGSSVIGERMLIQQLKSTIAFVSDIYLAYIFWTVMTALGPTLFYYSVWELGVSGQELALLTCLSPAFLGITPFKDWARSRWGRMLLHELSLTALVVYLAPKPLHRFFAVSFGNFFAVIGATVDWMCVAPQDVGYQALVAALGFWLSSLSKHANHSNNPVWPFVDSRSGGYNAIGITLAQLAIAERFLRLDVPTQAASVPSPKRPTTIPRWLPRSVALGSLLFSLQCLLSDPTTLIAWSWTGYPIKGPVPHLHGSLTHIAQAIGLALAVAALASPTGARMLSHPLWFTCGAASAYVMYAYKDWAGYAGGWSFALFLMSVVPTVFAQAAATGHVARTCAVAWLVLCVLDVANVFTVAYAFVPGGQYFRERSDAVLIAQVAGLGLAFRWPALHLDVPVPVLKKAARHTAFYTITVLSVLSLLVTMYRWPSVVPKPHRAGPRIVRAGIWTVHFGIDNEGRDSQRRMRDLIKDMELDLVGLLETDLHRFVFGNRDLTRVIAEELGYYVDIGPGPNQHTWGAVLLSKFPIIRTTHHLLPSPDGELAPAIEAVIDMYGTEVQVIVSHNGQEETPLDRELQSKELGKLMAATYPKPVIFLGYVVTKPKAPKPAPYEFLATDGRVHDIDGDDKDRWCQYIFYRGLYRTSYARLSRSTITDTELQIGQFVVPRYNSPRFDDSHALRYMRCYKEALPEEHWFPMEYYKDKGGMRGHYYHVFMTPLYFRLPLDALL